MDNFDGYTTHKYIAGPSIWYEDQLKQLRAENAALRKDAERWRTYLKVFAEEELVEAEWKGPEAITAYIDAAMEEQK